MKKVPTFHLLLFTTLFILSASGCAHTETVGECLSGKEYGFWSGLIHGFIAPFSFVVSLFRPDIAIYAINNTGGWYDFGFILGIWLLGFGGGKSA